MTLFGIALRSHSSGFLGATFIGALFGVANTLGFAAIAGETTAERALFARQMELVGRQLSYLLPLPAELHTLAGYLQWRVFGTFTIVYAFWGLIAATGAGRGDEERGLVDAWLAAGVTRLRYLLTRAAAFLVVAAASIAVVVTLTLLGSIVVGETLSVRALAQQGAALLALTAVCFAWSLVVAQVATTRRGAGWVAGTLLLVLFLIGSATRSGGLEEVAWLSPFWLHDRSTPLLAAGTFDVAAVAALGGATVAGIAVAAWAFASRDLGGSPLRVAPKAGGRPARGPSADPFLRLPVLATIDQQRWWLTGWMAALAGLAVFLTSLTRTMVDSLLAVPAMRAYFERLGPGGYDTFIAVIWGSTALLLLSLFAILQVGAWVADDADGRLEAILAQPVSRVRVALERVATLLVGAALVTAAGAIAVWLTAAAAEIELSGDLFATGSALMLTVPFAFGAIGAVMAGWLPRLAVPLLTLLAIVSYFIFQFAPLFGWPERVRDLSVYSLYGSPIAAGIEWRGILTLLAIGILGTSVGVVLFRRRDVGR